MLRYMYHFDYDDDMHSLIVTDPEELEEMPPVLLNVSVVMIADKYLIEPLKTLAMEKLRDRLIADWGTEAFARAIAVLWSDESGSSSSINALKTLICQTVFSHNVALFSESKYTPFQETAQITPKFVYDYARAVGKAMFKPSSLPIAGNVTWYKCPGQQCVRNEVVFSVSKAINPRWHISCPLRCTHEKGLDFWKAYEVTK